MAILKNIRAYWVKLAADRPAPAFGDRGPRWEFQARTNNPAQKKEWEANNIKVTAVNDDDTGNLLYWKTTFSKATTKKDGSPQQPVTVADGGMTPLDPNTIGNESIVNIRIFQYPFEVKSDKPGGPSKKGTATMLMAVQVVKLMKYEKPAGETFDMVETEVIDIAANQNVDSDASVVDPSNVGAGNSGAVSEADLKF